MVRFNKYVEIGEPVATADGYDSGIIKAAQKNDRIIAVLEDMGFPSISWFRENAPDRIVECGVAEANAAVVAAGLAVEGFVPFIYSFAFAAVGRAYNQIRQSIMVDHFNVKILGRSGAMGPFGISHNWAEDIAATRALPNMVIVNAADVVEAEKAIMAVADYIGPVFVRLEAGYFSPPPLRIFSEDYPFELGKAFVVKDGKDATIIATGYMLTEAIRSAEMLEADGIDVRIINISTIKPLDEGAVIKAAEETGAIVTAENHSIIGGLGEAVASLLAENIPTPMFRVGIEDEFTQSGRLPAESEALKAYYKLRAEDLVAAVKGCLARKK